MSFAFFSDASIDLHKFGAEPVAKQDDEQDAWGAKETCCARVINIDAGKVPSVVEESSDTEL